MGLQLHRLIAALLILAFVTPAGAMCAPATPGADPMAGMSCCKKQAPATAGSMQRDCCRMSEQLPEQAPATPAAPRTTTVSDPAPALIALPVAPVTLNTRAHFVLESARGRPVTPSYLRTSVLLI